MTKERIVFVHGSGNSGAAAWPKQHRLAGRYDCLFVKRHGFDAALEPQPTDFDADMRIVLDNLRGVPGHLVAASQGAIAAMMAAVERPDLVKSLTLFEPACLSLTADLPVTQQHRERVGPMQRPPWEAPLHIVPGVPTLVITGAWEPLYEEVAHYLQSTGAKHLHAGGHHRPHDTDEGHQALVDFISGVSTAPFRQGWQESG